MGHVFSMTDAEIRKEQAWLQSLEDDHAAIAQAAAEWEAEWPGHCRACNGYGQHEDHYDPSAAGVCLGSGSMMDIEPCEALPPHICHRCGSDGLTVDGIGPCKHCGWDYGDGKPLV